MKTAMDIENIQRSNSFSHLGRFLDFAFCSSTYLDGLNQICLQQHLNLLSSTLMTEKAFLLKKIIYIIYDYR